MFLRYNDYSNRIMRFRATEGLQIKVKLEEKRKKNSFKTRLN